MANIEKRAIILVEACLPKLKANGFISHDDIWEIFYSGVCGSAQRNIFYDIVLRLRISKVMSKHSVFHGYHIDKDKFAIFKEKFESDQIG